MDRYKILCVLGLIVQFSLQVQSIPHPLITDRPPLAAGHDRFATEEDSSASTSSASSSAAQSEETQSANAPQASSASLIYEDGGYHPKSPPKPTKETPQTRPPPPQNLHELRLLCNLYREFHPPGCRMDEPPHRQNNNHRGLPAIIPPPPGFVPPSSSEEHGDDDEGQDMLEAEDDDDVELVQRSNHHQQHQSNNNRFHQNRPQVAHLDHNLLLPPMIPRDRHNHRDQESQDDDNNDDYNPPHYQDQQDIHRNGRLPYPPLPPPPPPQHRRERPRRPSHLDVPSSKPEMDKLLRKSMIIVPDRSCPAGKRRDARGYCRTVIRFQQYSNPGSSQRGSNGPGRFFYRRFVAVPALHFIIP